MQYVCSFLGHRDAREVITFTFSILSNQSDSIPSEILPSVFTRCFQYAVILGIEETVKDDPSSIVSSLTASVVCFLPIQQADCMCSKLNANVSTDN